MCGDSDGGAAAEAFIILLFQQRQERQEDDYRAPPQPKWQRWKNRPKEHAKQGGLHEVEPRFWLFPPNKTLDKQKDSDTLWCPWLLM